jgi:hypothetical protein
MFRICQKLNLIQKQEDFIILVCGEGGGAILELIMPVCILVHCWAVAEVRNLVQTVMETSSHWSARERKESGSMEVER